MSDAKDLLECLNQKNNKSVNHCTQPLIETIKLIDNTKNAYFRSFGNVTPLQILGSKNYFFKGCILAHVKHICIS